MERKPVKFTIYLPPAINEAIEFLRFKERLKKNSIVLESLKLYLPKKLDKYPDWKEYKDE